MAYPFKRVSEYSSFRPHLDVKGDYETIEEWCMTNNLNFSCVINSLLPAIAYALQNHVFESEGRRYLRADFGDVLLKEKANRTYVK